MRRTRNPVLAAAAVALAAFLGFQLRHDVLFALSAHEARDLGDARQLTHPTELPLNRQVRLAGPPDRESAVILDMQGSWEFSQFFRLLGTGSRVFVRRIHDPLPLAHAERDVFTGRLVRLRDVAFDASIRRHFSTHVSATHFLAPRALSEVLGQAAPAAVDLLGERVSLTPDDVLAVDIVRPGEVRLELPKERFPDVVQARLAIEEQEGEVVSAESDRDRHVLVVRFPDQRRDQALSALADQDRRVRIGPARATLRARVRELGARPDALAVGGRVVPFAEIETIRTLAPVRIPEDAVLLLEGERPRDHLKAVIALVFLFGFAVVNLLSLRRAA